MNSGRMWLETFCAFSLLSLSLIFVYDDFQSLYFVSDDILWLIISNAESVTNSFFSTWGYGSAYRPIARLSFFIDYSFFADNATGWILHNFLIHAINSALLFRICRTLSLSIWISFVVSVLFLTSPISSECALWISARTQSLSVLFTLFSVLVFVNGCTSRFSLGHYFWICAFLIASYSTYEAQLSAALLLCLAASYAYRERVIGRAELYWLVGCIGGVTALFLVWRRYAIGFNDSQSIYPMLSLSNIGDLYLIYYRYFDFLLDQWQLPAWGIVLPVFLLFWVRRGVLGLFLFFGLVISLAPFALYDLPPTGRVLYFAQLFPLALIILTLDGVVKRFAPRSENVQAFSAVGIMFVLLYFNVHGSRQHIEQYVVAGQLYDCTTRKISNIINRSPERIQENIFVLGLPVYFSDIGIWMNFYDVELIRKLGKTPGYILWPYLFELPDKFIASSLAAQNAGRPIPCPDLVTSSKDEIIEELKTCPSWFFLVEPLKCRVDLIEPSNGWARILTK